MRATLYERVLCHLVYPLVLLQILVLVESINSSNNLSEIKPIFQPDHQDNYYRTIVGKGRTSDSDGEVSILAPAQNSSIYDSWRSYKARNTNTNNRNTNNDIINSPTSLLSSTSSSDSRSKSSRRSSGYYDLSGSKKVIFNTGITTHKYQYWIDKIVRRLSPIFSMVSLWNEKCWSAGYDQGTCYSRKECISRGGRPNGMCAGGFGVCCVFSYTCDSVTPYNRTYFANPEFPYSTAEPFSTCRHTVHKLDGVCQLRLDFEIMELDIPDKHGECGNDRFLVQGTDMTFKPLCGELTGHHVYLPVGFSPEISLFIQLGNDFGAWRRWKIRITRIKCNTAMAAPGGCLQYYSGTTGRLTSFNYIHGELEESNMDGLNYGVCVRREMGYCAIQWSICEHHKRKKRKKRSSFSTSEDQTRGIFREIIRNKRWERARRNSAGVEISPGYSAINLDGASVSSGRAHNRPNFFGSNENIRCRSLSNGTASYRTPRDGHSGNSTLVDLLSCPPEDQILIELPPPSNQEDQIRDRDNEISSGKLPGDKLHVGGGGKFRKKGYLHQKLLLKNQPSILQRNDNNVIRKQEKIHKGDGGDKDKEKGGGFIDLFTDKIDQLKNKNPFIKDKNDGSFKIPKPSLLFGGRPVPVKGKPKPPPSGFLKHPFKPKIKAKPKPPPAGLIKHPFKPKIKPKPSKPKLKGNKTKDGNCTSKPIIIPIPIPIPLPIPIPIPIVPVVVVPFPFGAGAGGGHGGWDEDEGKVMSEIEPYMIRVVTEEDRDEGLSSFCMDWEQIPCDQWSHIKKAHSEQERSAKLRAAHRDEF